MMPTRDARPARLPAPPFPLALRGLAALLAAAPCLAVTPATVVGPDLQPASVQIRVLQGGRLSYFDQNRDLREEPLARFLQIRDLPGAAGPAAGAGPGEAMLELGDGQRVRGFWAQATADGQGLRWRHPVLGVMTVSLELVRAVVLHDGPLDGPQDTDRLWLLNGDSLAGYLDSVHADSIRWQPADSPADAQPLPLPLAEVRAIRLANPPRPAKPGAHMVWLSDGSRILADALGIARETLTMAPVLAVAAAPAAPEPAADPGPVESDGAGPAGGDAGTVEVPLSAVARIDLGGAGGRLVDLATLPLQVLDGGVVFGVPMPPRVEDRAIWLHAPVVVGFELPAGAARLALGARLAVDGADAEQGSAWADLLLIVSVDGQVVARQHLDGREPDAALNLAIKGRRLTLEVDPAANGPVMDRLWIRDPLLLLGPGD